MKNICMKWSKSIKITSVSNKLAKDLNSGSKLITILLILYFKEKGKFINNIYQNISIHGNLCIENTYNLISYYLQISFLSTIWYIY